MLSLIQSWEILLINKLLCSCRDKNHRCNLQRCKVRHLFTLPYSCPMQGFSKGHCYVYLDVVAHRTCINCRFVFYGCWALVSSWHKLLMSILDCSSMVVYFSNWFCEHVILQLMLKTLKLTRVSTSNEKKAELYILLVLRFVDGTLLTNSSKVKLNRNKD